MRDAFSVQQFGNYQAQEEIARGGMGVVFRGQHVTTGQTVAIKVMLATEFGIASNRKRFAREAEALARVAHPNVVHLYDYGALSESTPPYMVLELVEGEALHERLSRDGPLEIGEAVQLATTTADAIAACHAAGVLHRDLKPANVLIDHEGEPKLIDFGLVRDTDPSLSRTQLTKEGKFLGSPGYWAPEQAWGRVDRIGAHTDVYGLGALLFALLTGGPPNDGVTLVDVLSSIDKPKPRASSRNPNVPRWLDAIVAKALATDPARRYASVADLAQALRSAPSVGGGSLSAGLALVAAAGLAGVVAVLATRGLKPSASPGSTSAVIGTPVETIPPAPSSRWSEALRAAERALTEDPTNHVSLCDRGVARGMLGDEEGALADYSRVLELQPGYARAYLLRGDLRGKQGKLDLALEDFEASVRADDQFALAYYRRAWVWAQRDDWPGVHKDCSEAIRLDPTFAEAHKSRGAACGNMGNFAGAERDLNRALELAPDAKWADEVRGNLQLVRDRLAKLPRGESPESLAALERGIAHVEAGLGAEAIKAFTEAIQSSPGSALSHYNRGTLLRQQGRLQEAVDDLSAAIRLKPDYAVAYVNRAVAYGELERWKEMDSDCTVAIDLGSNLALAHMQRAIARTQLSDPDGAMEDYDRALELDPDHVRARSNRGTARLVRGNFRGAIADLDIAIRLGPGYAFAYVNRARALEQLGMVEAALKDARRAAELNDEWAEDLQEQIERLEAKLRE